jgi:hypothetical protein
MAEAITKKIKYYLHGHFLRDLDKERVKTLLFVTGWCLVYITNYSYYNTDIKTISKLETKLKALRYEALTVASTLTEKTRPSQVEELVRRQGLEIEKAKTPPYRLKKK